MNWRRHRRLCRAAARQALADAPLFDDDEFAVIWWASEYKVPCRCVRRHFRQLTMRRS